MKLIVLLVGLVLGAAGGIFFSANYPEYAAKLAAKENDLIAEGKRQAMEQIKAKLDGILSQQDTTPVKTPGSSMFGNVSGSPVSSPSNDQLKALSSDLGSQLTQLKAAKK